MRFSFFDVDDDDDYAVDNGGDCDELGVADYVEGLSDFYRSAEALCRPRHYIPYLQPYFDAAARSATVERLIEFHQVLQLTPETLFLAVYVLDAYLSVRTVERRDLPIVGVAAMLIASKYDDICGPTAYHYHQISGCPRECIVTIEKDILNRLEWNLSVPTPYVFLMGLLRAAGDLHDEEMKSMVFFFAELALTHYQVMIFCPPSMVAASAVYAARCTLDKKPLWTEALSRESGYTEYQVLDCAQCLVGLHAAALPDHSSFICKKYSCSSLGAVSLRPLATMRIEEAVSAGQRPVTVTVNVLGFLSCRLLNRFDDSIMEYAWWPELLKISQLRPLALVVFLHRYPPVALL